MSMCKGSQKEEGYVWIERFSRWKPFTIIHGPGMNNQIRNESQDGITNQ